MSGERDLLVLEGMSFYGHHGETAAEKTLGNVFNVDVELRLDLAPAGRSDHIADTLDYRQAFAVVREIVEGDPCNLLEAVADRLASRLLADPRVESVKVRVGKRPPIAGAIEQCAVIIERTGGARA